MIRLLFVFSLLALCPVFGQAPGLAGRKIEFGRDVHPVLQARCGGCHSPAVKQGGLSVSTVDGLKQGGANGTSIVPGDSSASLLVQRITGQKQPTMPLGSAPLSE